MKREEVFAFTEKCMNGEPATCMAVCPFHMDIKSFLKKVAKGKLKAAAKEMEKVLPFPVLISELCPGYCEERCQRKTVLSEETIAIRMIEQTCVAIEKKAERQSYTLEPLPQRIAVVGAGGVGLACALYLSRKRFQVVVFEKEDGWGGRLRSHEKFDRFDAEFQRKFTGSNVTFSFGKEVSALEELAEYDAVFLATGKGGEDFGLLSGWDSALGLTKTPNVFLSGEMTGLSLIEGMAHALDVSKAMESWIQTGNPAHAAVSWERSDCARDVPHPGEAPVPHVVPAGEIYTKEEAATEAARCLQCDCEECMKACEMLAKFKKKPPRIAIDVAQDGMTRNSVSTACITRQTWSCNQCGYCTRVCGEDVDIGGLFELSRKDRVESNLYPPAFHGYWMREMETAASEGALLRPAPGEDGCAYLFFPGCRLGGVNPAYTLKSYEALIKIHPQTGIWLGCCGVPALWAGEGERFSAHIEKMREEWEQMGSPAVIYACASCRRTFARFLPEVPLISLYELLDTEYAHLINTGACITADQQGEFAVFDPCAAFDAPEMRRAVRNLAGHAGAGLTDYDSRGKCCGFGGHIQLANPSFFDEVTKIRAAETDAPYLTYCVNCMEVFQNQGKEARHILDLIFGHQGEYERHITTLEEKRQNNISVKQEILKRYWNETFEPESYPWDNICVEVSEKAARDMERLLIPLQDVKQIIQENEEAGEGFENEAGEVLCRKVSEYLTCWVKYKQTEQGYQVREVYAHRMQIREDEQ